MAEPSATERELALALELRNDLDRRVAELQRKVERESAAPEPQGADVVLMVVVRFKSPGSRQAAKSYTYVLLKSTNGYYCTGGEFYASWDQVLKWLSGPRIAWHSEVRRMAIDGTSAPVMPGSGA